MKYNDEVSYEPEDSDPDEQVRQSLNYIVNRYGDTSGFLSGGWLTPGVAPGVAGTPYVGDVTPYHPDWYWDPFSHTWREGSLLTFPPATTSIPDVAKTEVIEYTETGEVDSSAIAQFWYNEDTERMTLRFKTGGLYSYDNVSRALLDSFLTADSVGTFFAQTFNKRDQKWPGAKHESSQVKFQMVESEKAKATRRTPDKPDAFKAGITTGHGQHFRIKFGYQAEGEVEVRAKDAEEALAAFRKYAEEQGYDATPKEITQYL